MTDGELKNEEVADLDVQATRGNGGVKVSH